MGNASVFPPTLHSLGPDRLSFIQHQMENCLSNPQHACELGLDHNDTDRPTRILKIRLTEDIYIHKHPKALAWPNGLSLASEYCQLI